MGVSLIVSYLLPCVFLSWEKMGVVRVASSLHETLPKKLFPTFITHFLSGKMKMTPSEGLIHFSGERHREDGQIGRVHDRH